jgi:hypothetical protein
MNMKTEDGGEICVSIAKAGIFGADSGMHGRIHHAKVSINIGSHCGMGVFYMHMLPDEARHMAACMMTAAEEADASEAQLMNSIQEAA